MGPAAWHHTSKLAFTTSGIQLFKKFAKKAEKQSVQTCTAGKNSEGMARSGLQSRNDREHPRLLSGGDLYKKYDAKY